MDSQEQIINKVAGSALVTFNLEDYYEPGDRILLDIKDQLYQGLIIKEKDFRDFIKTHAWDQYKDRFVAITCSEDAIVPTWAYMLVSIALHPYAKKIVFGSLQSLEIALFHDRLSRVDWAQFKNAKVVVKGCSKVDVPVAIYIEATNQLKKHASSLMFGEPCSTVPLYKKPKTV